MILRFLICSFLIIGWVTTMQAQLQKGSWMINGELTQNNYSFESIGGSSTSFGLLLAPELSYMVTNHLMLGGKLSIGLSGNDMQRTAPVTQHLLVRHYYKSLENFFLFYGGELIFGKRTITNNGGGSRTSKSRSAHLQSGMQIFLQEAIALEFLFDYNMINFYSDSNSGNGFARSSIDNGSLYLKGRLQFFIHPENKSTLTKTDYRFYPGDWLVGGGFLIGGNDHIEPEIQRFWGSGWTTGVRMTVGLSGRIGFLGGTSLVRKYFRSEKKGKIWLQAGAGIRGDYFKIRNGNQNRERWTTSSRSLSAEGTVGWSNLISPNFALDFFITRRYLKSHFNSGSPSESNRFSIGLILSGLLR